METQSYEYEVALSFYGSSSLDNREIVCLETGTETEIPSVDKDPASTSRDLVRQVAVILRDNLGDRKVFFDEWFQNELAGQSSDVILKEIYSSKSRMVVAFIGGKYSQQTWTALEWRGILDFVNGLSHSGENTNDRYRFFPLRILDGERPEGLGNFDIIFDMQHRHAEEVAEEILNRYNNFILRKPKRIRVCFISSEYPPHVQGGLGRHVDELTLALCSNCDIDIILPTPPKNEPYQRSSKKVSLYPITSCLTDYSKHDTWIRFASEVVEEVGLLISQGRRPSLIHCHDWATVLGAVACRLHYDIPFIYHVHLTNNSPLPAAIDHFGRACANAVTVSSKYMFDELRTPPVPIKYKFIINNGVNTKKFKPSADWPADDGYILFVGRLVQQKGVEYLLRAFSFVLKIDEFKSISLKIVGHDPVGKYDQTLRSLRTSLGFTEQQVEFVGEKKDEELVPIYQKARIVVVPSIYEPFGMTALEGMACKRPVIVSKVGGLQDIIEDGITGYHCQPKDHLDLAQWLLALLADDKLRQQIGRHALTSIRKNYRWLSVAHKFLIKYEDLVNAHKNDPPPPPSDFSQLKTKIIQEAKNFYTADDEIWVKLFPQEKDS